MDLRAADIVLVPLEVAGAIDLFTSEAEPVEPPAHDPPDPVSLFVAKPETFDDVLAGEATDLTGVPVLGHPAWSGRGRSSVIGPFLRRGAARFRQLTLFAIRLPVRGAALVGTHVARAAHSVSASAGPIASSGRRSLMAAGHSLRLAGSRGRVWLVAARHLLQQAASSGRARVLRDADTAALQVRHAVTRGSDRARRAFHELQGGAVLLQAYGRALGPPLRRGRARLRVYVSELAGRSDNLSVALRLYLRGLGTTMSARGVAFVSTQVARAVHSVSASAGPIASSGRRSLMAAGHSLRLAGARGRVWLVAARHSLQQAASSGRARVLRDADTAALQARHAVTRGSDRARRAFHELQSGAVLLQAYGRALGPPLRRGRARLRVHVSELAGRSDNLNVALRLYLRGLGTTIPQRVQQALQRFDGSLLFGRDTLVIRTVSEGGRRLASSVRPAVVATGQSLQRAAARGRVWLVAAGQSLQQAASSGRASRAFHELQSGAVLLQAYGRALGPPLRRGRARVRVHVSELAGRSDNLSVALRPYLRGLRATIPQPVQQALQRFDGSLLFGRHTLVIRTCLSASMVGVSIAMLFVISATPKPRSAQAVALRPAIEPVADLASADQERAAITAVLDQYRRFYNALDATSVSTIWRGLDLQALQRSFSALARQNLSFRKCEVNLASSDRARAMCTGVLSFVRRAGSEVEQRRNLSLTIELRQLDDRWQIVDVAAR